MVICCLKMVPHMSSKCSHLRVREFFAPGGKLWSSVPRGGQGRGEVVLSTDGGRGDTHVRMHA